MKHLTLALFAVGLLAGCRGTKSENTPIHPNLNMDFQEKFEPQEENPYFADNRAMRIPVAGTVARGFLRDDVVFFTGRTTDGVYVEEMPVAVNAELLARGQERYNIYCSVCHGKSGNGLGVIMVGNGGGGYGYTPAPSYHDERFLPGGDNAEDGYMYDVIANGVRSMPGYAQQIAVADRWAIVAYIRALQRSQRADGADLPADVLQSLEDNRSQNQVGGQTGLVDDLDGDGPVSGPRP
jgi:mono/diheme cytochrome c family protein